MPGHAASPTAAARATGSPAAGMVDHDAAAAAVVKRFVEGEWRKVTPYGTQLLVPRSEGDAKVFDMTIREMSHRIDALKPPVKALGYNGTWPGPTLRGVQRDTSSLARRASAY